MASGPYGTGGWAELVTELNTQFETQNLGAFAQNFKNKHGPNGNGGAGKTKYKFGHFADKHGSLQALDTPAKRARFLIDSGTRHWDSLDLLEHTIKHSLTSTTPKNIKFFLKDRPPGSTKARALIFAGDDVNRTTPLTMESQIDTKQSFIIDIECPLANP
jgi:hypothetical protein